LQCIYDWPCSIEEGPAVQITSQSPIGLSYGLFSIDLARKLEISVQPLKFHSATLDTEIFVRFLSDQSILYTTPTTTNNVGNWQAAFNMQVILDAF